MTVYQTGYFYFPSFIAFKAFIKWSGDNFEWGLVIALFAWLLLSPTYNKYHTEAILETPQRNDFYFVDYYALDKTSDPKYRHVPLRILEVKDQSILFKVGSVGYRKKVSAREHVKSDRAMQDNFYREDTIELAMADLVNWFESDVIYSAARPSNIYIHGWIVMHEREL
jgi:hypothetical protein